MVLASGFTSRAGSSGWLLDRWRNGALPLVVSEHLLSELDRTLREDRYFRARLTPAQVDGYLALLRADATLTDLSVLVENVATQPKDDLVLSTALSGGASHLVTRDRKLLPLDGYRGLAIISPGQLRALLTEEPTP
jgi:predicted nucleic acid-binding protein